MPLSLRPPRKGKTPNYEIRGTYLGVHVETTTGTPELRVAKRVLKELKESIERGEYRKREEVDPPAPPTFADATLAYLQAGGDGKFLGKIIAATGPHALRDKPLVEIDQIAIDNAARALYPTAKAATLNRQVYTPISAVLKRAGIERKVKRPKGWRGSKATEWLEPDQAFAVIREAYAIEPEFGLFCLTLNYTGMRLGDATEEALLRGLKLDQALLYLGTTKNSEPRPVHLPPIVVEAFRKAPPRPARPRKAAGTMLANGAAGRSRAGAGVPFLDRHPDEKLFRFCKGGRLYKMLYLALDRAKVVLPRRMRGFHIFCHTYGTWMHRYGGLDTYGLTRTGRWKDPDSADRYKHTMASAEARRADLLPVPAAPKKLTRLTRRSGSLRNE
jgi:integrase